jgi:hypothetical protein
MYTTRLIPGRATVLSAAPAKIKTSKSATLTAVVADGGTRPGSRPVSRPNAAKAKLVANEPAQKLIVLGYLFEEPVQDPTPTTTARATLGVGDRRSRQMLTCDIPDLEVRALTSLASNVNFVNPAGNRVARDEPHTISANEVGCMLAVQLATALNAAKDARRNRADGLEVLLDFGVVVVRCVR